MGTVVGMLVVLWGTWNGHADEVYDIICARTADAHPNLRAELTAFARQI
jgi:hypothetical protein